jgi:membrane-bound lytic murein transglycosylase F
MKNNSFLRTFLSATALIVIVFFSSCNKENAKEKMTTPDTIAVKKHSRVVLERILRRNELVATTDYNSTNYFIYRGEPMGYQYELLKSFADYLGVKLNIKIINSLDESFECLNQGRCDLIALGLTITKDRKDIVEFTDPLTQTRQVLVQRKPENWRKMKTWDEIEKHLIRDPINLAGETIYIQKNSTYRFRLKNLSDEIGADIQVIEDENASVEDLISMVAEGKIDYTVCDEHIALVNQKYYPDIDTKTAISFSQNIAWAVKPGADGLRDTINSWLSSFKKTKTYAYLYNKYFKNTRTVNFARSEYYLDKQRGGKISPYDEIIKKYSSKIGWDWRLLASLIYQESRFSPKAESWVGAYGLMQLMPFVAEKYGVDSTSSPEQQIAAGVKFIKLLDRQFEEIIPDKEERIKFVLAAYNAGIAHVYDARRLAEKYNKNPDIWSNNVDYYLLNKSKPEFYRDSVVKYGYCRGSEPYNFVNDIIDRYKQYKNANIN